MPETLHTDDVIDLKEEPECRRWCTKFGVRPKELKAALRAVGNKVRDVERYLGDRKLYSATVFPVSRPGE